MSIPVLIIIVAAYVLLRTAQQNRTGELYTRLSRLEGRVDGLSSGVPRRDSHLANEVERLEERVDFLEQLLSERPRRRRLPPRE